MCLGKKKKKKISHKLGNIQNLQGNRKYKMTLLARSGIKQESSYNMLFFVQAVSLKKNIIRAPDSNSNRSEKRK